MKIEKVTNSLGQTVEIQVPETPEEWEQRRREVNSHRDFYYFTEDGWLGDE